MAQHTPYTPAQQARLDSCHPDERYMVLESIATERSAHVHTASVLDDTVERSVVLAACMAVVRLLVNLPGV